MAVITVRDVTEARERAQRLQDALAEKDRLVTELSVALQNVRTLSALLPVCSWCGKIRNDEGEYERMETYIQRSVGTEFTHGMCPDCCAALRYVGLLRRGGRLSLLRLAVVSADTC